MDNKKRNSILIQIIIGVITFGMGIATMLYGLNFYLGKIKGSIGTCILLGIICVILSISSVSLTIINGRKYKK